MRYLYLLFCLILTFSTIYSQDQWAVYNYSNAPFVADNATSILVDKNGIVWIGLSNTKSMYVFGGLLKFDGYNWEVYKYPDFPMRTVDKIIQRPNGDIWFCEYGSYVGSRGAGITVYNGDRFVLDSTHYPPVVIFQDSKGIIWTDYEKYNGEEWSRIFPLKYGTIFDITEDKYGNIWVIDGVVALDDASKTLLKYDGKEVHDYEEELLNQKISYIKSIFGDSKGNLWLDPYNSYSGSLYLYKYDGENWIEINDSSYIYRGSPIFEDSRERIWFEYGHVLDDNNWIKYELPTGHRINDMSEDSEGNFWFATDNGIAVLYCSENTVEYHNVESFFEVFPNPSMNY